LKPPDIQSTPIKTKQTIGKEEKEDRVNSPIIVEEKKKITQQQQQEEIFEKIHATEIMNDKSFNGVEKKPMTRQLESQISAPIAEIKKPEVQMRYSYSGPPKINFSTWNERPKVEVSVMNDKDYIFGGTTTTSNMPREKKDNNNYNTIPSQAMLRKTDNSIIAKRDDDEVENNHLPKVLGVEYKKDVYNTVELRKKNVIYNNENENNGSSEITSSASKTVINIKPRPVTMDYITTSSSASSSSKTSGISSAKQLVSSNNINNNNNSNVNYQNSSTQFVSFNRLTTNHKKFTPIVHGFAKLDNISETRVDVKSLQPANKITTDVNEKKAEAPPIVPTKPAFLRSTSAGDINRNMKFTPATMSSSHFTINSSKDINSINNNNNNNEYDESPFAQSLRRTGLIEKMLTDDKKTESIFGKVIDAPKKQPSHDFSDGINNNYFKSAEEKIEKVTFRQSHSSVPPPPPIQNKPATNFVTFRKSAPADSGDSRNDLLDAIKNFNKDSLRRK
jgi:hypothetical protein